MVKNTLARLDDGTIQINFAVPKTEIDKNQEVVLAEMAKTVTAPGFRKGKVPLETAREKIDPEQLLEKTLGKILPDAYMHALDEHKIKPITYPKFEVIKQGDVWEIRATTAELPQIELGDYKNIIGGAIRSASLKKELTREEKEQIVVKTLLETIKVKIPKILLDDEVNGRLSALLARIEKLGLTLEGYLSSIGKTEQTLRDEYEKQVSEGITLELVLNKVADTQGITAREEDVEKAIEETGAKEPVGEEQKMLVRSVLKRRSALDMLLNTA